MTKTPATRQTIVRHYRQHQRRSPLWRRWHACRMREMRSRRQLHIVIAPLLLTGVASGLFFAMENPAAGTLLYTTCFLMLPWMYANHRYNRACSDTRRARHIYRLLERHLCH